ncbi:hypothetical protein LCGC14_1600420, partial [marine sediment metagenome]
MCFWIFVGVIMAWADIYRDKQGDIPETGSDSASHLEELDNPVDIPPMYRAEPAVLEAGRIIRGRSIAHFIPDG